MDVSIYAASGEQISSINLSGDVCYISGRVSRNGSAYYKGVGVPYRSHFTLDPDYPGMEKRSEVFYCGYIARDPRFVGKTGIFQHRFQPYFSDFIGSCGPKELAIIENSREFERSGVVVHDCIQYDPDNHQYYFVLDYALNREGFLPDGDVRHLVQLLEYLVLADWNIPWDKTSIADVSRDGTVFDVADLFRSADPTHKLGTMYALLYSLAVLAPTKYRELLRYIRFDDQHYGGNHYAVFAAMFVLEMLGISYENSIPQEIISDTSMLRWHVIGNILVQGRNCAHQEFPSWGDSVRSAYAENIFSRENLQHLRTTRSSYMSVAMEEVEAVLAE